MPPWADALRVGFLPCPAAGRLDNAIALAVVLAIAAFASWALLPARYLPGNRVRSLRLRLRLRLHPGKGFASITALWWRWGRLAAWRRSGLLTLT